MKVDWLEKNSPEWLKDAAAKLERMPKEAEDIRNRALSDLNYFAALVNPGYVYGEVHREIYRWMQDYTLFGQASSLTANKLIMLPRGHLKSHMVATWCAWMIARHPEVSILYISATAELAIVQLYAIKNILGGNIFMRFFPEYIHPQDGNRNKWSSEKIIVDHPARDKEGTRDATVATAGLTTVTTGWHADIVVADDLVVPENAYTEDGRESVAKKASQFTSIRNAGGFTMACGTRYHPSDTYDSWREQVYEVYDDDLILVDKLPVWEIKEMVVEENGIFIWPRTMRKDGKAFGFDRNILARIKAEYQDITQFYAQYYQNPNDSSSDRISRDKFQYYNPRLLKRDGSRWTYNGKRLNIYAAVDFAFSLSKQADYSAIVVVGITEERNYYVLDIERFKTKKTIEYFEKVRDLHSKWKFNKLRAECTVAQAVIVESIKDYIKQYGMSLSVDEFHPSRQEGSKEQRIAAALEHLYDNQKVWHNEGGYTAILEEELVQARPAHDDIKDALAAAVSIAVAPQRSSGNAIKDFLAPNGRQSRFGGYAYR